MRALRTIERWSLYVAVGLTPLVTSNLTALGAARPLSAHVFGPPKLSLLALSIATGLVALAIETIRGTRRFRWHASGWLVVGFLATAVVSASVSQAPAVAWLGQLEDLQGVLGIVPLAGIWLLAINVADGANELRRIATATALGGAAVVGYAFVQLAGFDPTTWGSLPFEAGRAFATFGNPDPLAGYLAMPLALAPALALTERRAWLRVAWWTLAVACLVLIIASGVRGAWIAAAVSLVLTATVLRRGRTDLARLDQMALAGAALAVVSVVVVGVFAGFGGMRLDERVASALDWRSGSVATRLNTWRVAVEAVADAPLLGTGPDTFRIAWYRYRPVADIAVGGFAGVSSEAHSQPLQLAATMGLSGAVLWTVLVLASTIAGLNAARSVSVSRSAVTTAWCAAVLSAAAYLCTGIADVASSAVMWTALACSVSSRARVLEVRPTVQRAIVVLPAAVAVVAASTTMQWLGADAALAAARAGDTDAEVSFESSWLARVHPQYLLARADLLRDRAMGIRAAGAPVGDFLAAVDEASAAYGTAANVAPWEHDIAVRWSSLLNEAGPEDPAYYRAALRAAQAGIRAYPASLACRVQAALALYGLGRFDEAVSILDPAWSWDPATREPARILVEAALAAGTPPKRVSDAVDLLRSAPDATDHADLISRWEDAAGR